MPPARRPERRPSSPAGARSSRRSSPSAHAPPAGRTEFSASLNRNETEVANIPARTDRHGNPFSFVDAEDVFDTEHALPKLQGVFTARHWWERFDVMGRAHWYGDYRHANRADFADPDNIQRLRGKALVDRRAGHRYPRLGAGVWWTNHP